MLHTLVLELGTAFATALLALWVVSRFRDAGPQSLRSALVLCVAAFALLQLVGPAMRWVLEWSDSAVALLAVVVPALVFSFWSAAVLMRAFLSGPVPPAGGRRRRR